MVDKRSLKGKGHYLDYKKEGRAARNREARILRHLAKHPEDQAAREALKEKSFDGRKQPKRNKPVFVGVYGELKNGARIPAHSAVTTLNNRITSAGRLYLHLKSVVNGYEHELEYNKDLLLLPVKEQFRFV